MITTTRFDTVLTQILRYSSAGERNHRWGGDKSHSTPKNIYIVIGSDASLPFMKISFMTSSFFPSLILQQIESAHREGLKKMYSDLAVTDDKDKSSITFLRSLAQNDDVHISVGFTDLRLNVPGQG